MSEQLALGEAPPATPEDRAVAVAVAFQEDGAVRVASMQARSHHCPFCGASVADTCVTRRRNRLQKRIYSHPSRVALTMVCAAHTAAVGQPCFGQGVCEDRLALIADVAATMTR